MPDIADRAATSPSTPAVPAPTPPRAPQIHPSWLEVLEEEFAAPYMADLRAFLESEQAAGAQVYPPRASIFRAFDETPFDEVRVVILGQDPYHGPGQAMGLSFSVPRGVRVPPSLCNIFAEIESELDIVRPAHGDLSAWAQRGVLLLNTSLTVRSGEAGSHRPAGWERFTAAALRAIAERREGIVFLLWGRHAQAAGAGIDRERHLVLESAHPSPLSATNGFFGNGHFARTNAYLSQRGEDPIDWTLPG